uniref:Uncharacterized protein n=1 Tax=uncultured Armatimonadetes bacterium TaxID=157466 RepID=A0A6J4H1R1_9BACT|nr:hypothetical protein AVDCRST_MAG63-1517 [uncultured Armatimonadetes bacterium]
MAGKVFLPVREPVWGSVWVSWVKARPQERPHVRACFSVPHRAVVQVALESMFTL